MNLTIIVAASQNSVIGMNEKLPWKISKDLKRFEELTLNHPVIMGRKTWDSIPEKSRPLPERKNIVMSKHADYIKSKEGIYVAKNFDEALNFTDGENSYIIGGSEIYQIFLPVATKIELTRVYHDFGGDAFFPEKNFIGWKMTNHSGSLETEEGLKYAFITYERDKQKLL